MTFQYLTYSCYLIWYCPDRGIIHRYLVRVRDLWHIRTHTYWNSFVHTVRNREPNSIQRTDALSNQVIMIHLTWPGSSPIRSRWFHAVTATFHGTRSNVCLYLDWPEAMRSMSNGSRVSSAICLDRQSKAFLPNPTSTQYITPTFNKTKKTNLSRKQLFIFNKTRVTLKHVDFVWLWAQ